MSAIETNLDDNGGLRSEAYLDALVDHAPSVDSLLNDVRRLQIYKGFIAFAPPDDKCGAESRLISQLNRGGTRPELDGPRDVGDDLEDPRVRLVKF